jgi:hypothetical protein
MNGTRDQSIYHALEFQITGMQSNPIIVMKELPMMAE